MIYTDIILFSLKAFAGITGFCLLSIWIKELIQLATGYLLAPKFGFRLKQFSIFHIVFSKEESGWVKTRKKPSILIQNLITVDLSQQRPAEEIEKNEKRLEALRVAILMVISAAVLAVCLPSVMCLKNLDGSILDHFLAGLAVGLCWHSIVTLGIRLYVYGILMKKLLGYVQTLTNRLRAGESFRTMYLRPVEELPYQNPTQMEKNFYYNYYIPVMLMQGNPDAIRKPIREMTSYFRGKEYSLPETLSYYWLIFYYSRYELNPSAATHFLNCIRNSIEQDKDANGKRVLAYYAFGIEQDFPKARRLLNEAYAVLDKFSSFAERELEQMLLDELNQFLRQKGQ